MIIRKTFKFENAHIVRFCSSTRCRTSIHGHSYKAEILLSSNFLDNAGMVYDFGLMKQNIATIIDGFDHSTTIFSGDNEEYKNALKKHLQATKMQNGEREVKLHSVIVHETDTGYAQCFAEDAYNLQMGEINLDDIIFSPAVVAEWENPQLFNDIRFFNEIVNPKEV